MERNESDKLLSEKVEEFMAWLEEMTDFCEWETSVKIWVHKKLIEILTQK
jgi:hypothetical protein